MAAAGAGMEAVGAGMAEGAGVLAWTSTGVAGEEVRGRGARVSTRNPVIIGRITSVIEELGATSATRGLVVPGAQTASRCRMGRGNRMRRWLVL